MANVPTIPKSFDVFDNDLDQEIFNVFKSAKILAVDTEAMGLVHGRDRLCLVQICDEKDNVCCIRIQLGQNSSPNLQALMESNEIEKVFHYARFDISALASNLNIEVKSIFCTKIASKLARTYSPRHGLKEVVMELVGIELDKQAQSSDWGKVEELSTLQLAYAANDVRFLIAARHQLKKMLKREDRWELARKCFQALPVIAELDRYRYTNIFDH